MNILQKINSWVSKQPEWVDDAIHFAVGIIVFWIIFGLLYWGLPPSNIWGVRCIAFLFPIFIGALEESANVHPDYGHDMPGYVMGAAVGLFISIFIV